MLMVLVRLLGPGLLRLLALEALIDRLAAAKTIFHRMPVVDATLTHLPAKEHNVAVNLTREVEQAGVQVFYLDADGIDLGDGILGRLNVGFESGALAAYARDVDEEPTREKNLTCQFLETAFDRFSGLLALYCAFQQGFQHRQQGLRLVQCEGLHFKFVHLRLYFLRLLSQASGPTRRGPSALRLRAP